MADYNRSLGILREPARPEQAMKDASGSLLATVLSFSANRPRRTFIVGDAEEFVIVSVNHSLVDSGV